MLPIVLIVVAMAVGITALNRAITGDPLVFPHELYDRTHDVPPVFLWQPLESPAPVSDAETGWREPRSSGWHRLAVTLYFFLGLSGVLALVATPAALRHPWSRFATLVFLVVAAGHFLIFPWWVHYSAPAMAALLVPAVEGHRHLYVAKRSGDRHRRLGPALFAVACATQLAAFLVQMPSQRADPTDPSRQRARLAWDFEGRPGKHVLLVTYPPGWGSDWTYNPADVDAAKVVWATDLGAEANADLFRYYGDRTIWGIDAAFTHRDPVPRLLRPAAASPQTSR